jgi:hypothetical protein
MRTKNQETQLQHQVMRSRRREHFSQTKLTCAAFAGMLLLGVAALKTSAFADVNTFNSKSLIETKSNTSPVSNGESYLTASGVSSVIAKLGPVGYEIDPLTGNPKVSESEKKYRAIYFTLSATPVLVPVKGVNEATIRQIENTKQDLKRFDTVIEIVGFADTKFELIDITGVIGPDPDETKRAQQIVELEKEYFHVDVVRDKKTGKPITPLKWAPAHRILKEKGYALPVEILAMLPNSTIATTEDNDLVKAAKVAAPVADILTGVGSVATGGLLPASSFGFKLKNTAGGLTTIFENLVPPKSVPTQYAFQQTQSMFGWYFRQNTRHPETASILGTHNGAVILRLSDEVKAIGIRARTLTVWKKPVLDGSPFDSNASTQILTWDEPEPKKKPLDSWIKEILDSREVMISRGDVIRILSGKKKGELPDGALDDLIRKYNDPDDKRILRAAKGGAITKESLLVFLGLKAPDDATSEAKSQSTAQNVTTFIVPSTGQGTFLSP